MMRKIFLFCLVLISSFVFAAQKYEIIDMRIVDSHMATPHDINDNGEVCGSIDRWGDCQLFKWSRATGMHLLGIKTNFGKIDSQGRIIGVCPIADNSKESALFIWDEKNGLKIMSNCPAIMLYDCNDLGEIVYLNDREEVSLWDNGKVINLKALFDAYEIRINNRHELVGAVESKDGKMIIRYHNPVTGVTKDIAENEFLEVEDLNDNGECLFGDLLSKSETFFHQMWTPERGIIRSFEGNENEDLKLNSVGQIIAITALFDEERGWIDSRGLVDEKEFFNRIYLRGINNKGQMIASAIMDGQGHCALISPVSGERSGREVATSVNFESLNISKEKVSIRIADHSIPVDTLIFSDGEWYAAYHEE